MDEGLHSVEAILQGQEQWMSALHYEGVEVEEKEPLNKQSCLKETTTLDRGFVALRLLDCCYLDAVWAP